MTDTLHTPADRLTPIGTGAPPADNMPVGNDDKAIIGVFDHFDAAPAAVERLVAAGFPVDRISFIGKDLHSETRISRRE